MLQNLNFKDKKKLFEIVMRKGPNKDPQNRQKYILQQKNVVAGKNVPYVTWASVIWAFVTWAYVSGAYITWTSVTLTSFTWAFVTS